MSGAAADLATALVPLVLGWDDPRLPEAADACLAAGQCLLCPTDTVYGIAARAADAAAVCRLQAAKGRDWQTPPPVLIADLEDLNGLAAAVPPAARRLAAACWPGPLTLVFDLAPQAGLGLGDGAATVAVRLPDCEPLRRLLRRVGPLAVSSANRHGRRPATTAAEALSELGGRVALCVDGGPTPGPVPSSIVSFAAGAGGRLLRWGRLGPAFLRRFAPGLDSSAAVSPAAASGSETAD